MVYIQQRSVSSLNTNYTFNECSKSCLCTGGIGAGFQDDCLNRLIDSDHKYQWKMLIKKAYR